MKKLLLLAALCLFSAGTAAAQQDPYREAVAELMQASGSLANVDAVARQMLGYLQGTNDESDAFWANYMDKITEKLRTRMVDIYVPIYRKYLTLEDLQAMTEFYASPVGQKLVAVTPQIMGEGMEAGTRLAEEVMVELQAELAASCAAPAVEDEP